MVAAFFSAFAAWKLYEISKDTLNFQKSLVKYKSNLSYIDNILNNLIRLKELLKPLDPLNQSDSDFDRCDILLSEIKDDLNILSNLENEIPKLSEVNNMGDVYHILGDNPSYLDDTINQLKKLRDSLLSCVV
jgi:hypothetical protein